MKPRAVAAPVVQILIHAVAFAIAGYALAQIVRGGSVVNFAIWFVGAAVLHDLLLFPFYSVLDRLAGQPRRHRRAARVPTVNYVRVPALISGLLLLVYFPLIFGLAGHNYYLVTGHHLHGYARNWLLVTAVLFAGSGLLYAIRVLRARQ
jgi:hypothetical protein